MYTLHKCMKVIKMSLVRFKVSELLPDIPDLFCGCKTLQINVWMHQLMPQASQTVPTLLESTMRKPRFP